MDEPVSMGDPFMPAYALLAEATRVAADSDNLRLGHRIALAQAGATWALAVATRDLLMLELRRDAEYAASNTPDLLAGVADMPGGLRLPS